MREINRFQMASILEYLDAATAACPPIGGLESHAAWNIRMARQRLYAAALADVAVETVPEAANDTTTVERAA
jgi:hypothetical protein